jgi:hypothetical protein
MMSLDQIRRELKAIVDFDVLFSSRYEYHPTETAGVLCRKLRKRELIQLARLIASKN